MKLTTIVALLLFFQYVNAQYTELPASVDSIKNLKVVLNGEWLFNPSPEGEFSDFTQSGPGWKPIKVPGEWVLQGFDVESGTRAAYLNVFDVPADWTNHRVILRCDAVFSDAIVWINGKMAGSHLGGMTAFEFDVTKLIKTGSENKIVVGVKSESIADTLMSGSQYAAHTLGGILRKIYLFVVPDVYLGGLSIVTDFDDDYNNSTLKINGTLYNITKKRINTKINTSLFKPDGTEVLNRKQTISFLRGEKEMETDIDFNIISPEKWDAEHPNLYTLHLIIESENQKETIIKKIGFRKIEVVGNQVFLNGKPIKLRGVNRHETHPLLGRSLIPELWLKDALLFKEANVNYIRTSHYPPAEEFISICDSIGLYVELENPLCWIGHGANAKWENSSSHNSKYYPYFEQVSSESIEFLGNHPSIIIWSMANESAWGPNWEKLLNFYKKTDPTRPQTFHDQAYGGYNNFGSNSMPVANIHYPGLNGPAVADTFSRPLLFGEYSHLNCYNREEIATDPGVRDSWGKGIKKISNLMYESRGCLGGAIWSGINDIFYLPSGKAVGYGDWGPIDGWRRKKPEYYHMKKAYSPVKIVNTSIKTPDEDEPVKLQIENRFDFTDLNECSIEWDMGEESGKVKMNLQPKRSGILKINTKTSPDGKVMHIRTYSPLGYLVDETSISIGTLKKEDYHYMPVDAESWTLDSTKKIFTVKSDRMVWSFDRTIGRLISAKLDGEQILIAGAELMMLPLKTEACKTEHSLNIPFLNEKCTNWEIQNLSAIKIGDTIKILTKGSYQEATGEIEYVFLVGGRIKINYHFTSNIDINPRQWGLVFSLDGSFKNLEWSRKGIWAEYPDDHIGRTRGKAVPFISGEYIKPEFGVKPENKWMFDANILGSNDFRSTKENIYRTTLTNKESKGILVNGYGTVSTRTWVEGEMINILIAGFNTGGGDMFFSGYYRDERRPLKPGDEFSGTVDISMIEPAL